MGLINRHWTLGDCSANISRIFKQAFSSKNRRKISRFKQSTAKYRSEPVEQAFRLAFTENQPLLETGSDGRVGDIPRVLIPVTSSTGKPTILSNYVRRGEGSGKHHHAHYMSITYLLVICSSSFYLQFRGGQRGNQILGSVSNTPNQHLM